MLFAFFDNAAKPFHWFATAEITKEISYYMKSCDTLKLNKDFRRLYYRGKSALARSLVIYAQKNRFGHNRIGLTCGKTIGCAVTRNRAKRLLRESYRNISDELQCGYDIVIVARTRIVEKKCGEVMRDMRYAFSKLDMFI